MKPDFPQQSRVPTPNLPEPTLYNRFQNKYEETKTALEHKLIDMAVKKLESVNPPRHRVVLADVIQMAVQAGLQLDYAQRALLLNRKIPDNEKMAGLTLVRGVEFAGKLNSLTKALDAIVHNDPRGVQIQHATTYADGKTQQRDSFETETLDRQYNTFLNSGGKRKKTLKKTKVRGSRRRR